MRIFLFWQPQVSLQNIHSLHWLIDCFSRIDLYRQCFPFSPHFLAKVALHHYFLLYSSFRNCMSTSCASRMLYSQADPIVDEPVVSQMSIGLFLINRLLFSQSISQFFVGIILRIYRVRYFRCCIGPTSAF